MTLTFDNNAFIQLSKGVNNRILIDHFDIKRYSDRGRYGKYGVKCLIEPKIRFGMRIQRIGTQNDEWK